MVAVSHVALVTHVTAHFGSALEQCELCVSQAHPQAAIPASEFSVVVPDHDLEPWGHAVPGTACPFTRPYDQRGPPARTS